jgi:hypothetical protein
MEETKNQLIQTGFTLDRLHQDGKIDDESYTILKDRNKQAINYSQCCKSDSEQLNAKYKQSFDNWLKNESIEIDEEGIYLNDVKLVDGDTLLDVYETSD